MDRGTDPLAVDGVGRVVGPEGVEGAVGRGCEGGGQRGRHRARRGRLPVGVVPAS
jgi:hypothetical protein